MEQKDDTGWASIDRSTRVALLVAAAAIFVPIFIVLIYLYVSGYAARDWSSNVFYAAFMVWIPFMIWLRYCLNKPAIHTRLPWMDTPERRENVSSAIAISAVFAVIPLERPESVGAGLLSYLGYFATMLALFAAGSALWAGLSFLWARFR